MTKEHAIQKVLHQLRSKLGTTEHPPGSNHNFITVWYNNHVARIGDGAWCQMTDTWAVWSAGFKKLLRGTAYTVYAAQNAQKKVNGSTWHPGTKGMRAGDQVYYDWSGSRSVSAIDHTGTVEKILGGGYFYALEGNSGDALRRVKRDGKFVVGYVRLDWSQVADEKTHAHHPSQVQHKPDHPHADPTPDQHPPADKLRIEAIQKAVGVKSDGQWGDKTDEAVLKFRKAHYKKF